MRPPGPVRQLCALLALRWQMARTPGVRLGLALSGLVVAWLLLQAVRLGRALDPPALATAVELAPALYVGFGVLALLAPLAAGGGQDVVPPDGLATVPVRPATLFSGGLLLAPLNLVWVVQLLGLTVVTSCLTLGGSLLRGSALTAAYVLAVTVLGQGLAWTVAGLRRTPAGRRTAGTTAVIVLAAVAVAAGGDGGERVRWLSARTVVDGVIAGGDGDLRRWGLVIACLLGGAAVVGLAGARACRWSLLRPGDVDRHGSRGPVRRRAVRAGALRELLAVDRASVWRAPALRRGAVVLAVLPGLLAAGVSLPWASLVVLPGLVAAGAALLFGVNAFALDGSGSLWLASQPCDPRLLLRAKAVVLSETVLGAVAGTVAVAAAAAWLRDPAAPTAAELTALAASVVLCTSVVVVLALHASVRRPFQAELRGPRDAVAPPGALAMASVRLALPTTVLGILLGGAAGSGVWWLPPALALPLLGLCALSAVRTSRRWADPAHRAYVVHRVANG